VAFAGEEHGLLGSAHYANNPALPLSNTVAMLDLDMIGRSQGKLQTSGLEKAPSLEGDLLAAAKAVGGIDLGRQGPGAGRSDDANFLQRRIPAIIFFTGFHSDYHRPGDDWEKIDAPGTARVAMIALEFAARIAARPDRPAFVD
jgi:Zn-dependent M28 family amino/carboxypeptidase